MKDTTFGSIDVCDAHVHFFSHRFYGKLAGQAPTTRGAADPVAAAGEVTGFEIPDSDPGSLADRWVAELDAAGVSKAMIIASVPGDEASVSAAVSRHPGRFVGAFMLDPTHDDTEARARRAFTELGLSVACLFPAMLHFSVAENDGVRAVAALAADHAGRAVFTHFGALSVGIRGKLGIASRFDMRRSNPVDLHPLASEFASTNFIVPHFGAGLLREALMLADLCPNVLLDTSSSNKWMRYTSPPADLAGVFRQSIAVAGASRLLFGTDSSFFPRGWNAAVFDSQLVALEAAGATEDDARAILGGNFRRVLGEEEGPRIKRI